jgi:hypothetical protein
MEHAPRFPIALSPCLPIASSSRYTARLLSDVVFTGVVRQRCQSCLLRLSNQRTSARLGSLRLTSALLGKAWRNTAGRGVGCLPSDAQSTSQYICNVCVCVCVCVRACVRACVHACVSTLKLVAVCFSEMASTHNTARGHNLEHHNLKIDFLLVPGFDN